MIIKMNSDRTAHIVMVAFKNVDGGGSITQNGPVCFVAAAASTDGYNAVHPAAALTVLFAGIAEATVPINGNGHAVAWGLAASCIASNEGTSITIGAGHVCVPIAGTNVGVSSIGGASIDWANIKYLLAGSSLNVSAVGYLSNVQVRAL